MECLHEWIKKVTHHKCVLQLSSTMLSDCICRIMCTTVRTCPSRATSVYSLILDIVATGSICVRIMPSMTVHQFE